MDEQSAYSGFVKRGENCMIIYSRATPSKKSEAKGLVKCPYKPFLQNLEEHTLLYSAYGGGVANY